MEDSNEEGRNESGVRNELDELGDTHPELLNEMAYESCL